MSTPRRRPTRPAGIAARLARAERETGAAEPRDVTIFTDDYGHTEYPMGKPRPGDRVTEIHLGGVSLEDI